MRSMHPSLTAGPSEGAGDRQLVYLLRSGERTYVGATKCLPRRLRQHNGEIGGGARQTSRTGPWVVACTVTGFRTFGEALKFEHAWRREGRRCGGGRRGGIETRRAALDRLTLKERWSRTSPPAAEVPLEIAWS